MSTVAFDFETWLIAPGRTAPKAVCLTWQFEGEDKASIIHARDPAIIDVLKTIIAADTIIGQNVAFDMGVICANWPELLPLVFKAYEESRVTDTKIRQQLLDISQGCFRGKGGVKYGYSLEDMARRHFKKQLDKDTWRLHYRELYPLDVKDWPQAAIDYPLADATTTMDIFKVQEFDCNQFTGQLGGNPLEDQYRQTRAAWALHLSSAWGLRTDAKKVDELEAAVKNELSEIEQELIDAGLVRPDGSRDTKLAQARMLEVVGPDKVKKTDGGAISVDADSCKASEDHLLEAYAELTTLKTMLSKDVEVLRKGTVSPIHTRYDMATSGRTTSSNPNVQNFRRTSEKKMPDGTTRKLPDVRSCFVPRTGFVFAQADYGGLELVTLAQVCLDLFGHSEMAKYLNEGKDIHTATAANLMSITYEEGARLKKAKDKTFDSFRQTAKVLSFGFPGGLGPARLVYFARKSYGVTMTEIEAKALKRTWLRQWPEMNDYFRHVDSLEKGEKSALKHVRSNRYLGGASYTARCNSYFQGLGADVAKHAMWATARLQYGNELSWLRNTRTVLFCHDEIVVEVKNVDDAASGAAKELSAIMVAAAKVFVPDVRIEAEPALMAYYSKNAQSIYDSDGNLEVWNDCAL